MNNLRTYITALFAALLLYSCSEGIETQQLPAAGEEGQVYITLSFKKGGSYTRTEGDREDEVRGEAGISNICLVLVDNSKNARVIYNGPIGWVSGTDGTSTSDPIKVEGIAQGITYHLYMAANGTSKDGSTQLPTKLTYDDIIRSYTLNPAGAAGMEKLSEADYFMMTNVQNAPSAGTGFDGGVKVVIQKEHPKTAPLCIWMDVERLSCKVTATVASEATYSAIKNKKFKSTSNDYYYSIDRIELDGIGLVNCVTDYNLIQRWEGSGEKNAAGGKDQWLVTPSSSVSYSIDRYYNRIAEYRTGGKQLFKLPDATLFCMENNSPYYKDLAPDYGLAIPDSKMQGRTTGILFRVRAHIIQRSIVTDDIIKDDQSPGAWTKAGGTTDYVTLYRYNGILYAKLQALIEANPSLGVTVDSAVTELRNTGIDVYEGGYMYYLYWIKDNYYTDGGKSYYAVTRNTWYHLKVMDINNIGTDVPGGSDYDESGPIEYQPSEIGITLECAEWNIQTPVVRPIK